LIPITTLIPFKLSPKDNMKKPSIVIIIFGILIGILISGCVGEKTVKQGDRIQVDYVGRLEDGSIFDTSIQEVAEKAGIYNPQKAYQPLNFTVGGEEVLEGFDSGVIGMKVGETKTIVIPPEKGYGQIDLNLINIFPQVWEESLTTVFPKKVNITSEDYQATFQKMAKIGDVVQQPRTSINLTIVDIRDTNVTLNYNLKMGDVFMVTGRPWNETVVKIDAENITIRHDAKKNQTLPTTMPWNITVINISEKNMTLRNNPVPNTTIQTYFGVAKISFNETSIIFDFNHELAGKTLIFNVTVLSFR